MCLLSLRCCLIFRILRSNDARVFENVLDGILMLEILIKEIRFADEKAVHWQAQPLRD